jgi:hypothetical protein
LSWRRRIGWVLLSLGAVGALWETVYVFRTGGHWHTDLVTWFLVLSLGWWFHAEPVAKRFWRRAIGISLAMLGAVGIILGLKIAVLSGSYFPLVPSLVNLILAAWLLRSAARANRQEPT